MLRRCGALPVPRGSTVMVECHQYRQHGLSWLGVATNVPTHGESIGGVHQLLPVSRKRASRSVAVFSQEGVTRCCQDAAGEEYGQCSVPALTGVPSAAMLQSR
jgi:hypothetical protein